MMMPKLSGYELAKRLRAEKVRTPILMLTARDSVPDVVRGLDLGADDYMTKPFSFDELVARLRAVKRRALVTQDSNLRVADLVLDPASSDVLRGEERVSLTRTEYNLLERLMYRAGKVVSRRSLIESVWGFDREIEENTLDAFMHLLRNKVDAPGRPKLIHTVRGVGYMIRADGQAMKRLSIGVRLTLWYLAIFAFAQFVFGAGMWFILRHNVYDMVDDDLENQVEDLKSFFCRAEERCVHRQVAGGGEPKPTRPSTRAITWLFIPTAANGFIAPLL